MVQVKTRLLVKLYITLYVLKILFSLCVLIVLSILLSR